MVLGNQAHVFSTNRAAHFRIFILVFVRLLEEGIGRTMEMFQSEKSSSQDSNIENLHLYSSRMSLIPDLTFLSALKKCMERTGCAMNTRQLRQYLGGMLKHWLSKAGNTDIKNGRYSADKIHAKTGIQLIQPLLFTVLVMVK